jgi:type I restriction enzyme S subunit
MNSATPQAQTPEQGAEWSDTTLGELADFEMGQAPPGNECNKEGKGTVFVKAGEFADLYPVEIEWTTKPLKYGRKGDVFICVVGATAGKLNLGIDCAIGRSVAAIRPRDGVDTKFIYYQLMPWVLKLRAASSGSAQGVISKAQLKEVPFKVAPLDQQKRIVAEIEKQFSRLDEAVANLKRVKANLKRYKAAVLKAAVEGRLVETEAELARREGRSYETGEQLLQRILETRRSQWKGKGKYKEPAAPDTTDLPELPEGWVWASVDQLVVVVRGASPRPAGDPKYFGGTIPWITVGPITAAEGVYLRSVPESVTELGKDNSRYIEPGTLLLTNSGATLGVPKITLIGGCINDGVAALLEIGDSLKIYLLHYLSTLTESLRRINQGAAQPNLNTNIIRAIPVPLPPSSEQDRIVAEVDRRLTFMRALEIQIDVNDERSVWLRQAVLHTLFGGINA